MPENMTPFESHLAPDDFEMAHVFGRFFDITFTLQPYELNNYQLRIAPEAVARTVARIEQRSRQRRHVTGSAGLTPSPAPRRAVP
jgi:hypothetical protein